MRRIIWFAIVLLVLSPFVVTVAATTNLWYLSDRIVPRKADNRAPFSWGGAGVIPVTGDWNGDGIDTPGWFRSAQWRLSNHNSSGGIDYSFGWGANYDTPVVGDWNGDGRDTPGVYYEQAGRWNLSNHNSAGGVDHRFFFGGPGYIPLAGDWNGDGITTPGLYKAGQWYLLDTIPAFETTVAPADATTKFSWGSPSVNYTPLVGDWDGDGMDTPGHYLNGAWGLSNVNKPHGVDQAFSFGGPGFLPLVGTWDGEIGDTPGLYAEAGGTPATPSPEPPPRWLVLLYLAGDDVASSTPNRASLTNDLQRLLSALRALPPTPEMSLAVLYDGMTNGDSRVYVRPAKESSLIETTEAAVKSWNGTVIPDGRYEFDTGSANTVSDFITYARNWAKTFTGTDPDHTFLAIVDHGGGWAPDTGPIPQPGSSGTVQAGGWRGMSLDLGKNDGTVSSLSTHNTGQILADHPVDVLFFDACLMGMVESAYEIAPYASYFVAGQNLTWSRLPYATYLKPGVLTAKTSPRDLAARIVEHYNQPTPSTEPFTISAIDTAKLENVVTNTNILAEQLLVALPDSPLPVALNDPVRMALTRAYTATQKFDYDSSYTIDPTDGYVDLADFAIQLLRPQNDISPEVDAAAQAIVDAISGRGEAEPTVVAMKAISGTTKLAPDGQPWNFAGAHGLSIYLPLGEQDYRPSDTNADGKPIPKRQLDYYSDPAQLAFTLKAPSWADLLVRLEENTPQRTREWNSPLPAESSHVVYLPALVR
jgi:hypothetical protein